MNSRRAPSRRVQEIPMTAEHFLERWGMRAARLSWEDWQLYGCHRRAAFHRIQGMGLVLLLRGDSLAALTETEAVIRTGTAAHQTYRRKLCDPLHPSERCLVWELS